VFLLHASVQVFSRIERMIAYTNEQKMGSVYPSKKSGSAVHIWLKALPVRDSHGNRRAVQSSSFFERSGSREPVAAYRMAGIAGAGGKVAKIAQRRIADERADSTPALLAERAG
jgi:hypothetical protein